MHQNLILKSVIIRPHCDLIGAHRYHCEILEKAFSERECFASGDSDW